MLRYLRRAGTRGRWIQNDIHTVRVNVGGVAGPSAAGWAITSGAPDSSSHHSIADGTKRHYSESPLASPPRYTSAARVSSSDDDLRTVFGRMTHRGWPLATPLSALFQTRVAESLACTVALRGLASQLLIGTKSSQWATELDARNRLLMPRPGAIAIEIMVAPKSRRQGATTTSSAEGRSSSPAAVVDPIAECEMSIRPRAASPGGVRADPMIHEDSSNGRAQEGRASSSSLPSRVDAGKEAADSNDNDPFSGNSPGSSGAAGGGGSIFRLFHVDDLIPVHIGPTTHYFDDSVLGESRDRNIKVRAGQRPVVSASATPAVSCMAKYPFLPDETPGLNAALVKHRYVSHHWIASPKVKTPLSLTGSSSTFDPPRAAVSQGSNNSAWFVNAEFATQLHESDVSYLTSVLTPGISAAGSGNCPESKGAVSVDEDAVFPRLAGAAAVLFMLRVTDAQAAVLDRARRMAACGASPLSAPAVDLYCPPSPGQQVATTTTPPGGIAVPIGPVGPNIWFGHATFLGVHPRMADAPGGLCRHLSTVMVSSVLREHAKAHRLRNSESVLATAVGCNSATPPASISGGDAAHGPPTDCSSTPSLADAGTQSTTPAAVLPPLHPTRTLAASSSSFSFDTSRLLAIVPKLNAACVELPPRRPGESGAEYCFPASSVECGIRVCCVTGVNWWKPRQRSALWKDLLGRCWKGATSPFDIRSDRAVNEEAPGGEPRPPEVIEQLAALLAVPALASVLVGSRSTAMWNHPAALVYDTELAFAASGRWVKLTTAPNGRVRLLPGVQIPDNVDVFTSSTDSTASAPPLGGRGGMFSARLAQAGYVKTVYSALFDTEPVECAVPSLSQLHRLVREVDSTGRVTVPSTAVWDRSEWQRAGSPTDFFFTRRENQMLETISVKLGLTSRLWRVRPKLSGDTATPRPVVSSSSTTHVQPLCRARGLMVEVEYVPG